MDVRIQTDGWQITLLKPGAYGGWRRQGLKQLYEFGLDLYRGGEQHGYLHKQAFHLGAARGYKAALVTVEVSADNTDAAVAHGRRNFVGTVILRRGREADGVHKSLHVGGAHGHGHLVTATQVTVLQHGSSLDHRVECRARSVDKEQVVYERHLPPLALAVVKHELPHHGSEGADVQAVEQFVSRQFGIGTGKVAHDKPLAGIIAGNGCYRLNGRHANTLAHCVHSWLKTN